MSENTKKNPNNKSSKRNAKAVKKNRKGLVIAAVAVVVVALAALAVWYTGRTEYKLGQAGYTKTQIAQIKNYFTEEEQKLLAANKAQPGILQIVTDNRFQEDQIEGYLKGLAEGKSPETLLDDFDPWVIAIRAAEGYREE